MKFKKDSGMTLKSISEFYGISIGMAWYWINHEHSIEEHKRRRVRYFNKSPFVSKMNRFKSRKPSASKVRDFQRRNGSKLNSGDLESRFSLDDVIKKFGENPRCYLTGRLIDLSDPKTFHFDHITPASKGGSNALDNLGLLCREANRLKSDQTIKETIELCKEIIANYGG